MAAVEAVKTVEGRGGHGRGRGGRGRGRGSGRGGHDTGRGGRGAGRGAGRGGRGAGRGAGRGSRDAERGAGRGGRGAGRGGRGAGRGAGHGGRGAERGTGRGGIIEPTGAETENIEPTGAKTENIQPPGADSTHIFSTTETWPTGVSAEQRGETEALPGAVTGTGSRDGNRRETLVRIEENIHPIWFTAPLSCQPPEEEMKERRARAYAHAMGIPYRRR